MRIRVVAYDADWPARFHEEAAEIARTLDGLVADLHHIGSTAVPEIFAKPIIDILLEVSDVDSLDDRVMGMERLGYESLGEYGIKGRRYFRKENPSGIRTHHVHAFQHGDPHVQRHLAFRNYLIAHPDVAAAYSILKQKLATQYPDDIEAYMDGKDPFIKAHEAKALAWASGFAPRSG